MEMPSESCIVFVTILISQGLLLLVISLGFSVQGVLRRESRHSSLYMTGTRAISSKCYKFAPVEIIKITIS